MNWRASCTGIHVGVARWIHWDQHPDDETIMERIRNVQVAYMVAVNDLEERAQTALHALDGHWVSQTDWHQLLRNLDRFDPGF
jgi:hypothetical protein